MSLGVVFFKRPPGETLCRSEYSHVGLMLTNPRYMQESLEGKYVVMCSELSDGKLAVQMHYLPWLVLSWPGGIEQRGIVLRNDDPEVRNLLLIEALGSANMQRGPGVIDPLQLIEASFGPAALRGGQPMQAFVCSALLGFVLCTLGALPYHCKWATFTPDDFRPGGSIDQSLSARGAASLGPVECLRPS